MSVARLAKPFASLLPGRLSHLAAMVPDRRPVLSATIRTSMSPSAQSPKMRVALLTGCVQSVLDTAIQDSTIRLLNRLGAFVVISPQAECCGGLAYHMGMADFAKRKARASIEAWWKETRDGGGPGIDAIVINTSGCGTSVKDYGHMFRMDDPVLAKKAEAVAALAVDITEFVENLGMMAPAVTTGQRVAYHAACSLQHGQRIRTTSQTLLRQAGFDVKDVPEGHLCCGSAGTYNMLQPELSTQMKQRKIGNIESLSPDIVATGNLGCILQIGGGTKVPIVHTVQLLDWATGGPRPEGL
jgi:glycolate oxidase iron-sulfur subunit